MKNSLHSRDPKSQSSAQHPVAQSAVAQRPTPHITALFATGLICALVFGVGGYVLGKQSGQLSAKTAESQTSLRATDAVPALPADVSAEISDFSRLVLANRNDLRRALAEQEIQMVRTDKQKTVWIVETIDKEYVNNQGSDQDALPRHAYVVTKKYWRPIINERLQVECLVAGFEQTAKTIIVQTNGNCPQSLYLYHSDSGAPIAFHDPKGLVSDDKPWILGGGVMKGIIPADVDFGLLEVSYGDPAPYATAYYNVDDGRLLDLVVFETVAK